MSIDTPVVFLPPPLNACVVYVNVCVRISPSKKRVGLEL